MAYAFAGTYGPAPITDLFGHPLTGLTVAIFETGTQNLVNLYTDRSMVTPATNPTSTDDIGNLKFFCAPGQVDISGNNATISVVIPPDPADLATLDGSTFTGPVSLAADPTTNLGAATKEYVDSHGGGGGGSVASVFGRTGTVVPINADYSGFYDAIGAGTAAVAGAAWTGGDLIGTGLGPLLNGTENAEQMLRSQAPNQLSLMSAALNFNTQGATWMSFFDMQDGTAADGRVRAQLNPPLVAGFANAADTQAVWGFGQILGAPFFSFGPGGTTAPDIFMQRSGALALGLTATSFIQTDGTSGHGKLSSSLNPPVISGFAASGDANPAWTIASFSSSPFLSLGPGGATAPDVVFSRSGTATATLKLATFNVTDGTGAHGQVSLAFNPATISGLLNSSDTQAAWELGTILGQPTIGFGTGGSTAIDVLLARSGAGALTLTGTLALSPTAAVFTSQPPAVFSINPGNETLNFASATFGSFGSVGGTLIFQQAGFALGSGSIFSIAPTLKNLSTAAVGFGLTNQLSVTPIFTVDTQTGVALGTHIGLNLGPSTGVANSGTATSGTLVNLQSAATVGTGTTVTSLTDINIKSPTVGGTLTTHIGLDVAALTNATNNMGIRNASPYVSTPSSAQVVAAAFTVTANAECVQLTSAGSVSATTAAAVIVAGQNGQQIVIVNANTSANTLTFTSGATELLSLGAATRAVAKGGSLTLVYNSTFGRWVEIAFNAGGN